VRARADESRTHRSLLSNLPLVLKTRTPTGVHPLSQRRLPLLSTIVNDVRYTCPSTKISPLPYQPVMLRGAKHRNSCPTKTLRSRQTPRLIPLYAGECPLLLPPQHLMMAGPSFGLGEKAAPRKRGGHSLPVYGEGWGGAGRGAAQLTHTSTVAVSQDAGECPPSPSPARGGKKGGCHAERHPPACHLGYPAATWFAASSDSEPAPRTGRWDTDGPRALAPSILVPISR
jgi:hypothetical protein